MTMRKLAILAFCGGVTLACDRAATAPTPLEIAPTPAQIVPPEVFPLPPGAPPEAAVPPNTARVTITTIEIVAPDGTSVAPEHLKVGVSYTLSMWVFVPRGLEGFFDFGIQPPDSDTLFGGGIRVPFDAGYTRRDFHLALSAGGSVLFFVMKRDFVTLASKSIVLVVA